MHMCFFVYQRGNDTWKGILGNIKYFKVKYICFLTAYVRVGSSRSVVFVDGLDSP